MGSLDQPKNQTFIQQKPQYIVMILYYIFSMFLRPANGFNILTQAVCMNFAPIVPHNFDKNVLNSTTLSLNHTAAKAENFLMRVSFWQSLACTWPLPLATHQRVVTKNVS